MIELLNLLVKDGTNDPRTDYLRDHVLRDDGFVASRLNRPVEDELSFLKQDVQTKPRPWLVRAGGALVRIFASSAYRSEICARLLLSGADRKALEVGRLRSGGNVHLWMYDRFSLEVLFRKCGFTGVARREANESAIAEWGGYCLDSDADGKVRRFGTLYMEGERAF